MKGLGLRANLLIGLAYVYLGIARLLIKPIVWIQNNIDMELIIK